MKWKSEKHPEAIQVLGSVLSGKPVAVRHGSTSTQWIWDHELAAFFVIEKKGSTTVERSFPLRHHHCRFQSDEGVAQVYFESTLQPGYCALLEFELAYQTIAYRADAKKAAGSGVKSPITGTVLAVHAQENNQVEKGDLLFVIEAMKMENKIVATAAGVLGAIGLKAGDKVQSGELLVKILAQKA